MKASTITAVVAFAALFSGNARADDVCQILARDLKQDVLTQGTISEQFLQFRTLVSDDQYQDWNNASSSSHSFNGSFSIPEEVDLAIGDGQKSDQSNWGTRRAKFLSKTFQDTSAVYRSSTSVSVTNVAALQAISNCASQLAEKDGVYTQLVSVSPNRDSFTLKLWRRTSGDAAWNLEELSVQPGTDARFSCFNDWNNASLTRPRPLLQQAVVINCQKNPEKHLLLAVQTTAGPGGSFDIDSVNEEIKKLREDTDAKLSVLQAQLDALSGNVNREVNDRASAINSLSSSLTGVVVFAHEDGFCPAGYNDLSIALFPRWRDAFAALSFIVPKDKPTSGSWPGNADWRLDHIKLCMRG